MPQALAWRPVNRRLVLPLLLLTVALLAGLQAQRTERSSAMYVPVAGAMPARAATPLFSVRRIPEFLQAPTAERKLTASLLGAVTALPDGTCLVVAEHGRRLYSLEAGMAMVPASTQKILTAIAALLHLGPSTVLTTRVVAEVPVVDGIVDGDVWLVGGGDPLLTTSGYAARFDDPGSYTDLGDLVKGLLGVGVREITGGIVGDESRYDAIRYLGTWPDRFKPGRSIQSGPLSALSVDDGFEKWDPVNTAPSLSVPAADPAANAASLLDDLLEVEGVVIRRRPDSGRSPAHPGMVTLVEVASLPVSLLVRQMLVHSDNTTAELLVKELGRTPAERGTTVAGLAVMLDTLERAGHDVDQVVRRMVPAWIPTTGSPARSWWM
jgi:D-alanyl-D-alanine carboxypeptidase/D-alanyl-D-alanine-endopeptidase (penicillin-binding protein 4)